MAPKGGKGQQERFETRTVLQAVLLADSFTQRFRPITVERPKVLLPLVNVPMIEYALEWLATNKVEEVFVFCCAHADQIKLYLSESKWATAKEMTVTPIISTGCLSAGEALRILDQRDVIKSDFVLISGDTVANLKLAPMLEAHRARRSADKNAIFTMLMKPVSHPHQRLRLGDTETVVCLDPSTNRLLKYSEADPQTGKIPNTFKVDAAFFGERDSVQVRTDLMDTNIAICAPEVLMLFSDNFDYQNVKKDFVSGVLSEEELGNKLYVQELQQTEYAVHIHNLRSYDAVSRDILQRWCFPFSPDTNLLWKGGAWGQTSYRYARGNRYFEQQQVCIQRTAQMGEDVCVGAGSQIGDHSKVFQSVVGRNCRIGKGATIVGCYLQDNVTIQDNAVLHFSLVCEHAVIQAGAVIGPGSVISYGVVVGAKHSVPSGARLSLCQQLQKACAESDDDLEYAAASASTSNQASMGGAAAGQQGHRRSEESEGMDSLGDSDDNPLNKSMQMPSAEALKVAEAYALGRHPDAVAAVTAAFDPSIVGSSGAGYLWRGPEGPTSYRHSIYPPSMEELLQATGEVAEVDGQEAIDRGAVLEVAGSGSDSDEEEEEEQLDPESSFRREVSETFLRCVKMRFDPHNAVIELNGLKIAEDRSFADCARYILTTMLALCAPRPSWVKEEYASLFISADSKAPSRAELLKAFAAQLKEWGPLLQRFLKSEDDQVELLLTFEEYCGSEGVFEGQGEHGDAFADVFEAVLKLLYDTDVLSEEAVLAWADEKEHADEEERRFLSKATKLVEWLRTASEDEDDEEEDDEDDEDEEGDE